MGQGFKNGPSKVCGREPLKNFKWSILEYLDLNIPLVTLSTIFKSGKLILVDSIILSGPVQVIIALFLIKDLS